MTSLIVSDLHLGAARHGDVARRRELREPLLEALRDVDELILLGDLIEFREGPAPRALEAARGFLEDVGQAMGSRRVVVVPGNHDHELIAPWLERRRCEEQLALGVAERIPPHEASTPAGTIAEWLAPAEVELAYPGIWLRPDVYATHGHYVDPHITVPSFERLGARAVDRLVRRGPGLATPDDYEAVLSPIYALLHAVAQVAPDRGPAGTGASERAWRVLAGNGRRNVPLPMQVAARAAWPAAIGALNRAGLGPLSSNLSVAALQGAAVTAIGEVLDRLGIEAEHVIYGHVHRAGPLPEDDPGDWVTRAGTHVTNSGCWVYSRLFSGPTSVRSPYWPGVCVRLEDDGPPRLERLLEGRRPAELRS